MEMSRLTRDGTTEPVSRDQILRRERGQRNTNYPCSADHEQVGHLTRLIITLTQCDDHIHTYSRPVQRLRGGRGCNNFVPVLRGNGTKIAPNGDIFDQSPGGMSWIQGTLADHVGDHVVLSPEECVLVTSLGTESSYPHLPQSLNNSAHGLRPFQTWTTTQMQLDEGRKKPCKQQVLQCKRPLAAYNLYCTEDVSTLQRTDVAKFSLQIVFC